MWALLYRIWRLPLRHAIWLLLPVQILAVWVCVQGWQAKNAFDSVNVGGWGTKPPDDFDQVLYFLRDELRTNIERMLAPPMPVDDHLDTISLTIDRESLARLNANLPRSGKENYYRGVLETVDGRTPVKVRYMGDNHWHWLFEHKSWRIKTTKGDPIRDTRRFNIKNAPTSLLVDEAFIAQVAIEQGLLVPEIFPVKMVVNNSYAGLSLWWPLADESLLRRFRRMPGSIYRGDGAPPGKNGVSNQWYISKYWVKVASRNLDRKPYRGDIDHLTALMNRDDPQEFHDFAERHLALEQWIKYVSIDRLFGSNHHDYYHNHKLYFDPYKGRWEPIMWDYGTWFPHLRPADFDSTRYPILNKIRRHPEYELRLQRKLYELVTAYMPVEEFERRWDDWFRLIEPALAADARRDHRDWPRFSRLWLQKIHSAYFSMDEYRMILATLKRDYRARHAWWLEQFDRSVLTYKLGAVEDGVRRLDLMAAGHIGQMLDALVVSAGDGQVTLWRDSNLNGQLDASDELVSRAMAQDGSARLAMSAQLYPGLRIIDRVGDSVYAHGVIEFRATPLTYPYFIAADGGSSGDIEIDARNLVTDRRVAATVVDRVPSPQAADLYSLHPWKLRKSTAPERVTLGPGTLHITEDRVFAAETTVTIAPGTVFELDPGVSLFFEGKLIAKGTAAAPIRVKPSVADAPWGVFDLYGAGTAGSRLSHCHFSGGSVAERDMVQRSGMVTVMDSSDIKVDHCMIGTNHIGDDAMHWGYVKGGLISACRFEGARSDALDMDICEDVHIENCVFRGSGNDCVDLMTSRITIADCHFDYSGDKGVSVGESSSLDLRRSTFDHCVVGLEVKDNSDAVVDAITSFAHCETAVNLYRKNTRYSRGGRLKIESLQTRDCRRDWKVDQRSVLEIGGAQVGK